MMNTVLHAQGGIFYGIISILLLFLAISSLAFCSIARRISAVSEISLLPIFIFTLEMGRERI